MWGTQEHHRSCTLDIITEDEVNVFIFESKKLNLDFLLLEREMKVSDEFDLFILDFIQTKYVRDENLSPIVSLVTKFEARVYHAVLSSSSFLCSSSCFYIFHLILSSLIHQIQRSIHFE